MAHTLMYVFIHSHARNKYLVSIQGTDGKGKCSNGNFVIIKGEFFSAFH